MSGKPAIFPALDHLPIQAQDHAPPSSFDINTLFPASAADHPTGPGEHFAPHATVNLPDGGLAGIENASDLPTHISDWLLI
jgi:hypothetical protein